MDLEQVIEVMKQIRDWARQYRDLFAESEAQTRLSLIDPLLRAFGWRLEDPAMAQIEAKTKQGNRVDYLLKWSDGRPAILLEAKRLGGQLDLATAAVVGYAWELRREDREPKYVGLTDGLRWILAEPGQFKNPFCQIDLGKGQQPMEEVALRLAEVLWRRWWMTRGELAPTHGLSLANMKVSPREQPPRAVVFPDGTRRELGIDRSRTWRRFLTVVAEWLASQGKLRSETKIVRSEPTGFRAPFQLPNGLWIDLHLNASGCVSRARRLCEASGIDPAQVLLEW